MSSDDETIQSDPLNDDLQSLPSFNLVATPSVGEEREDGSSEEEVEQEKLPARKRKRFQVLDRIQAELWELREQLISSRSRKSFNVERYKPSAFKPRAKLGDNFALFETEFTTTLPDELSLIFLGLEAPPSNDLDVDAETLEIMKGNFHARNVQAFYCLSTTLIESGKLSLINNCKQGDGLAAWKYLKANGHADSNMAASEAVTNLLNVSMTTDESVPDLVQKERVSSAITEVARLKMLPDTLLAHWLSVIYAHSMPPSLNDVKRAILMDASLVPKTMDQIYAMVKAQRAFALANGVKAPEVTAAKAIFHKSEKPPFKKYVYEKPTDEERAGSCTVCGKAGHGARTCRKRFRKGKPAGPTTGKETGSKPVVEGNVAYFDEEVDAFHADLGGRHLLHGKAFSSDNEGDGPPKRVSLPIGPPSDAELNLVLLIFDTRVRLRDFVSMTIGAADSITLITTLLSWGWEYPEEDLRSFTAEYNTKCLKDQIEMLRWIEAMKFPFCRPSQFRDRQLQAYPARINGFEFARRGFLAEVEANWTRDSVTSAMFGEDQSVDPFDEPHSIISNTENRLTGASSARAEIELEDVQEDFQEVMCTPAYASMDPDDRRYLRNGHLDLVHNALTSLREIENFLDNVTHAAYLGHVSSLDMITLRAIHVISMGFLDNHCISRLLTGKIQAQEWNDDTWNDPHPSDPIVEYDNTTEETAKQEAYRRVESSSSSAEMDPNYVPFIHTVDSVEPPVDTEIDATFLPIEIPMLGPIASPVSSDDGLWSSSEADEWEEVYPVILAGDITNEDDDVEPPRKFGKGYSSDVTGDGPSTFSKGTNSGVGVGHRPKLVKFLLDSGCRITW